MIDAAKVKVYLAGPHQDDAYRQRAKELLAEFPWVEVFDPIKARDFRGKEIDHENDIVHGDLKDVIECDVILGNYSVPGWGTAMESWFARGLGRRIVAYVAPEARVSPWIAYIAGGYQNVHRSLEDACGAVLR